MPKSDTLRVSEYLLQTHQVSLDTRPSCDADRNLFQKSSKAVHCELRIFSMISVSIFPPNLPSFYANEERIWPRNWRANNTSYRNAYSCTQSSREHAQFVALHTGSHCRCSTRRLLIELSINYWLYPFMWLKNIFDHTVSHVTCLTILSIFIYIRSAIPVSRLTPSALRPGWASSLSWIVFEQSSIQSQTFSMDL